MMEATYYESVHIVSPCFGEIVNTLCGISETAPVTEPYCSSVDLIHNIRMRFSSFERTADELSELNAQMNRFRNVSPEISNPYQGSNVGTSKWRSSLHLAD